MRTTYYEKDDILVIHVSDKFAEDGTIAEISLLEARARGAFPVHQQQTA